MRELIAQVLVAAKLDIDKRSVFEDCLSRLPAAGGQTASLPTGRCYDGRRKKLHLSVFILRSSSKYNNVSCVVLPDLE